MSYWQRQQLHSQLGLSKKYPDVLPVDIYGRKRKHGARQNYCPNSKNFQEAAKRIVEQMAIRYKDHPAVIMWHISNEYGPYCYCENCARAFRQWLKERYKTLDELNSAGTLHSGVIHFMIGTRLRFRRI